MTPLSISHLPEGSPAWLRVAIIAALALHIGAGSLAILSGYAAIAVRKGGGRHRLFGFAFTLSMTVTAVFATLLAAWIGQRGNFVGGLLFFYLVATAWMTVRRPAGSAGLFERRAFLFALALVAMALGFAVQAWLSPQRRLDGYPMGPYIALAAMAAFFAFGDFRLMRRGGVAGAARLARHAGRMGFALFVATGSFFLGQQKVMPLWLHGSPILVALGLAPIPLTLFWLIRIRRAPRSRPAIAGA